MLSFSDFMKVYEAYTMYAKTTQAAAPMPTQTVAPMPTQTAAPMPTLAVAPMPTQTVAPMPTQAVAPMPTQTVAPMPTQAAQPSNADIMAALGALQTPFVNAPTPKPETIDDVICRIAGIQIPDDTKKGDK